MKQWRQTQLTDRRLNRIRKTNNYFEKKNLLDKSPRINIEGHTQHVWKFINAHVFLGGGWVDEILLSWLSSVRKSNQVKTNRIREIAFVSHFMTLFERGAIYHRRLNRKCVFRMGKATSLEHFPPFSARTKKKNLIENTHERFPPPVLMSRLNEKKKTGAIFV